MFRRGFPTLNDETTGCLSGGDVHRSRSRVREPGAEEEEEPGERGVSPVLLGQEQEPVGFTVAILSKKTPIIFSVFISYFCSFSFDLISNMFSTVGGVNLVGSWTDYENQIYRHPHGSSFI